MLQLSSGRAVPFCTSGICCSQSTSGLLIMQQLRHNSRMDRHAVCHSSQQDASVVTCTCPGVYPPAGMLEVTASSTLCLTTWIVQHSRCTLARKMLLVSRSPSLSLSVNLGRQRWSSQVRGVIHPLHRPVQACAGGVLWPFAASSSAAAVTRERFVRSTQSGYQALRMCVVLGNLVCSRGMATGQSMHRTCQAVNLLPPVQQCTSRMYPYQRMAPAALC